MRNTHIPASPPDLTHSFIGTRRPNVNAASNSLVGHSRRSNAAWLTYSNTPARIISQQTTSPATRSNANNPSSATGTTRAFPPSNNAAHASSGGYHLSPPNNDRYGMGSNLGPTGGWGARFGIGGGLRSQCSESGGMSAEARAEKTKRDLFNEALGLVAMLNAEKARELKGRWEREFGAH